MAENLDNYPDLIVTARTGGNALRVGTPTIRNLIADGGLPRASAGRKERYSLKRLFALKEDRDRRLPPHHRAKLVNVTYNEALAFARCLMPHPKPARGSNNVILLRRERQRNRRAYMEHVLGPLVRSETERVFMLRDGTLLTPARDMFVIEARKVATTALYNLGMSLNGIGRVLARDHCSVLSTTRRKYDIADDEDIAEEIEAMARKRAAKDGVTL